MALDMGGRRYVTVIDRTLPEIMEKKKLSRLDIIELSWALKSLGVDIIEVNSQVLRKIGKVPKGIEFMLRVSSEEDIPLISHADIRSVVVSGKMTNISSKLQDLDLTRVTIEYEVEGFRDLSTFFENGAPGICGKNPVLRFTGLNKCTSPSWASLLVKVKNKFKVKVDICPHNSSNMATSVALEGLMYGTDYISMSFMGIGKPYGLAPIEEVVAAAKVLINPDMKIQLGLLSDFCIQFTKISGIKIPESKPIIGKNIFRYESGIHADGIEKNPSTYEPFEPQMVGQKRKLAIGKHSGKKSVAKKLKELGISVEESALDSIVEAIRQESIKLGRSLEDSELINFFYRNEVAGM